MEDNNKGFGKGLLVGILGGAIGMFIVAAIVMIVGVNIFSFSNDMKQNSIDGVYAYEEGEIGPTGGIMAELSETEKFIIGKVGYLVTLIDEEFLFDYELEDLLDGMYYGMLDSLEDVYSVYYTEEEFKELMEGTEGIYYGIGVRVSQNYETGTITVVDAFPGTPAEEAGMLPGDILVGVADQDITQMDLNLVVNLIKSDEEGSKVKITVLRNGEYVDMMVERRRVEYPTVEHTMLDNNIGYLQLLEFDTVSVEQFEKALLDLKSKGMEGLVIDLRNNPGGTLGSVVGILDMVLPECTIIYTEDKDGNIDNKYVSDANTILDVPTVVLINGYSASAAEVFAGDMQDTGMATLVGTTTFGKGIVQQIYPIADGTAVKLTQSSYFTSGGRNIHGTGIEPDVYVDLDEHLKTQSVVSMEEDNQLHKAIEVLESKMKAEG